MLHIHSGWKELRSLLLFLPYVHLEKLCIEDFIELQEIIIPSVVGGVLGLLLLVIFAAYLIAFLRRKKREGRYETLNDGY